MTNLHHLRPYVWRYRRMLSFGLLCATSGAAISAFGPYVLRLAVDDIQTGNLSSRVLLSYGGLLILIACIDGMFKFGQRMLINGTAHRIDFDLRSALFGRLMHLDQSFYSQMHTGDLMARATNDLSAVRMFLGPGTSSSLTALLTLLASAALMFTVDVRLTLIVLMLLPVTSVVFTRIGHRMRQAFTRVQDQFGDLSTRAQENFSGIRTIKAYAQEGAELRAFAQANDRYRQFNLHYVILSGILWPSVTLILGGVAALVLFFGGRFVAQGTMTLGELVQFNAYLGLLAWPMIALGWTVNLYQQAAASMGRLNEVLSRQPRIATSPTASTDVALRGDITFHNVSIRLVAAEPPHASLGQPDYLQYGDAANGEDGWYCGASHSMYHMARRWRLLAQLVLARQLWSICWGECAILTRVRSASTGLTYEHCHSTRSATQSAMFHRKHFSLVSRSARMSPSAHLSRSIDRAA